MIAGIIVAMLGAAAIIVALFANSFGADEKQTKQIKQVSWILGILLLVGGGAWIGVRVYQEGVDAQAELLGAQTSYQVAQNESNPDVITARSEAYTNCYNGCISAGTWWERNVGRKKLNTRCDLNCTSY